jgi:serine phosphatase RsbU (regulator of sigma subunit)
MPFDPSLTVTGPRAVTGDDVEDALDGLVTGATALALSWDAAGACTDVSPVGGPPLDGPVARALAGDGWLRLVHADDRVRAAGFVAAVLENRAEIGRDDGVRLRVPQHWAVLRVQPAAGGGAAGVLVEATHAVGDTARLARIVGGLNRLRSPEEIVQAVLNEGMSLLAGRTAVIYVLSDAGDSLVVAGASGLPEGALGDSFAEVALDLPIPATEVMRTGSFVTVGSPEERRRRYPLLDHLDMALDPAFVVVPLFGSDHRPFGALAVGFADERGLTRAEDQFLVEVAAQCALALDRARLNTIAERRQQRLTFLDALSESLSSSLELEGTLTRLAEMTVPKLADWCVVRLVSQAGDDRRLVGAAHVVPRYTPDLVRLAQSMPHSLPDLGELGAALLANEPIVRRGTAREVLAPLIAGDTTGVTEAIGADTVAVYPLTARGRLLGGLAFGNRPGRPLTDLDLSLAELVATRAATLVDNARLFDERSGVARALQDSLLPARLPPIPGLALGARYRAAGLGLDVGGDFYDAFPVDDNWWVVAVGDVCGHGVEAAATTGLVRHTIRAAAMAGAMPSAILARLNQMLLRHSAELAAAGAVEVPFSPRFCTVVLGAVQPTPRGVDILLCLGGHPQPLVRRADGTVTPVGVAGTLLGVTENVELADTVVHLDDGEALVCFTDGLTDRRSGTELYGEEGIAASLAGTEALGARALAAHVEAAAVDFVDAEPVDDMAVLTLIARPGRT